MKSKFLSLLLVLSLLTPLLSPLAAIAETQTAIATPTAPSEDIRMNAGTAPAVSEIEYDSPVQGEALTNDNLPFAMTETDAALEGLIGRVKDAERDLHSVVFANADGGLTLYYYNEPIKYVDEDGNIRDKSNKLSTRLDGNFETVASDIQAIFPKQFSDGITLRKGEWELGLTPAGSFTASGTLSADQTTVTYARDLVTRYQYNLTSMGFKEDIVVNRYTGQTHYSFVLKTHGLTPVNQYGTWVLVDESNTVRACIGDVIIFTADERNNTFGELQVEEVIAGQEYRLTIVLDADWLADEATVYPITIDPALTYANTTANIQDITVCQGTTYSATSGSLYVGRNSNGNVRRALMRFPNLNILGYNITSATVSVRDLMCESWALPMQCYQYTGNDWSDSNPMTWSGMGDTSVGIYLSGHSVCYVNGKNSSYCATPHRYVYDITQLAEMWAAGTASPSKGVVFRATGYYEEGTTNTYKTFASINRGGSYIPNIEINYTPTLTITPTSAEILVGETLTLNATLYSDGESSAVSYVSSNNAVATVSSTGVVTGVSAGTVTITASADGADSVTCTVTVHATSLQIIANRYYSAYTGNIQVGFSANQPAGTTYTWATSKSSVATISAGGVLQFKDIGAVDVTITASTGDTATKTFYGIYPDGVYKLQNTGSYKFATLESDRIVEDVNISQYRDQSEALKQLWRVHYIGDGEYVIRSMQNPSLVMAMDTNGSIQRNVMAENMGTSDDDLPTRAKWYFRGTTYSMFTEATADSTTYRLAVGATDTGDYGNIFAITSEGSGATSWRLVEIDTVAEGVLIYYRNANATRKTYNLNHNDTKQFTAIFYTAQTDITQSFTWTSSDTTVATVNSSGRVFSVGSGVVTITATSTVDTRRSAYFYVCVSDDLDFDGVPDSEDIDPISNNYSGQIIASHDAREHDKDGSECAENCADCFTASYSMNYELFLGSATIYRPALAKASAIASTLAYHDRHWYDPDIGITTEMDIIDWLEYHGMRDVQRINITGTDDHRSEIIMGYRPVFNSTGSTLVISVIIRGTNGTIEEWSSNMDIGDTRDFANNTNHPEWTASTHHMGFDITSNRIMTAVSEYIENEIPYPYSVLSHTYWVTGHSRGGALANLVAAKLIDDNETVFAYTFAAPGTVVCSRCQSYEFGECEQSTGCTAHAAKYNSIFNIVNEDDFIPYFPLKQWYFTLYGRTTQGVSANNYSTLWVNSWKDEDGEALDISYMRMASPTAPLAEFYQAAGSRNACYDYVGDSEIVYFYPDYPSCTEGYYKYITIIGTNAEEIFYVDQKPMFLMKYFAAVAVEEVESDDFYTLDVADYLEAAKKELLEQITAMNYYLIPLNKSKVNKNRINYPHLPQTYCLLTMQLTSSAFN